MLCCLFVYNCWEVRPSAFQYTAHHAQLQRQTCMLEIAPWTVWGPSTLAMSSLCHSDMFYIYEHLEKLNAAVGHQNFVASHEIPLVLSLRNGWGCLPLLHGLLTSPASKSNFNDDKRPWSIFLTRIVPQQRQSQAWATLQCILRLIGHPESKKRLSKIFSRAWQACSLLYTTPRLGIEVRRYKGWQKVHIAVNVHWRCYQCTEFEMHHFTSDMDGSGVKLGDI